MANDIGAKIRFIRKLHGLNQKNLGDAIGYSRTTITNYEANARSVVITDLEKIANYFNISILYFFDGEQTQLEKELLPYIEGIKPLDITKLSPEKRAKIIRTLYEFETKYQTTLKLLKRFPKTKHRPDKEIKENSKNFNKKISEG